MAGSVPWRAVGRSSLGRSALPSCHAMPCHAQPPHLACHAPCSPAGGGGRHRAPAAQVGCVGGMGRWARKWKRHHAGGRHSVHLACHAGPFAGRLALSMCTCQFHPFRVRSPHEGKVSSSHCSPSPSPLHSPEDVGEAPVKPGPEPSGGPAGEPSVAAPAEAPPRAAQAAPSASHGSSTEQQPAAMVYERAPPPPGAGEKPAETVLSDLGLAGMVARLAQERQAKHAAAAASFDEAVRQAVQAREGGEAAASEPGAAGEPIAPAGIGPASQPAVPAPPPAMPAATGACDMQRHSTSASQPLPSAFL